MKPVQASRNCDLLSKLAPVPFADAIFFLQEHLYTEAALVQRESLEEHW
jgi:hypothetical protein